MSQVAQPRHFLFLQGPHGPFFARLAEMIERTGASVSRVGFNVGDSVFWKRRYPYIAFKHDISEWEELLTKICEEQAVSDIVLYGDTRPWHEIARNVARAHNITLHVFEEGYLRPYWVSYERGGSNGNSRLMEMGLEDMRSALKRSDMEAPLPPAQWGDMYQHIFYGALYHWHVMFRNRAYRGYQPHRGISVARELRLYLQRLLFMTYHSAERRLATRRIRFGGFPYHLCLLQLEHDSAFQSHSNFSTMSEFLETVLQGFAKGAPGHHHLVIKAHPLEDNRGHIKSELRRLVSVYELQGRVHFIRGGKLAGLLSEARSAVTVNSTSGQQALWRGVPLRVFGQAVYNKPEFVSNQDLPDFFREADRPDHRAYRDYRRFLLETSQVPGGFYSTRGRRRLLRHVVDMMLSDKDPYDTFIQGKSAPRFNLRVVGH